MSSAIYEASGLPPNFYNKWVARMDEECKRMTIQYVEGVARKRVAVQRAHAEKIAEYEKRVREQEKTIETLKAQVRFYEEMSAKIGEGLSTEDAQSNLYKSISALMANVTPEMIVNSVNQGLQKDAPQMLRFLAQLSGHSLDAQKAKASGEGIQIAILRNATQEEIDRIANGVAAISGGLEDVEPE